MLRSPRRFFVALLRACWAQAHQVVALAIVVVVFALAGPASAAWVRYFPGDKALIGEKIPMHHVGGGPITVPLPASRHIDAHMPGGYRYNSGGPGASG